MDCYGQVVDQIEIWSLIKYTAISSKMLRFQYYYKDTLLACNQAEKKLDGNYTKMLCAVFNKSWKWYSIKQQLYGHLSPISQTIQVGWARDLGHGLLYMDKAVFFD